MKAVVFEKFGDPSDVLQVQEQPKPEPLNGEVLIRMIQSPINPSDLMLVRGTYGIQPQLPATPGFEGVGIVEENGGGLLGRLLKGKRVAVLNRERGNWGEWTTIPAKQAIPIPQQLSDEQGATFFINPATATILTQHVLKIPKGAWLLQSAAASNVGRMVIRLGKQHGFKTINLIRREEQVDELKSLGADHVLLFDANHHSPADLKSQVDSILGETSLQFAIDPVGGKTASSIIPLLGYHGRLILYGTLSNQPVEFEPRMVMSARSQIEGFWLGHYMQDLSLLQKMKLVRQLSHSLTQGVLTSEIGNTFSLDEITSAVQYAESNDRQGKTILQIQNSSTL